MSKLHAHFTQPVIIESQIIERAGRTVKKARFADGTVAYQLDGARWVSHFSAARGLAAMFFDSEFLI